jgi:hypothetical protein
MIQRALKRFPFFYSCNRLFLHSGNVWFRKELSRTCFSDDGAASYPCKENYLEELQHVEEEAAKRKFYAIGEIGIDLYWDKTHLLEQQIAFRKQIQLAKQYKPIVIHCGSFWWSIWNTRRGEVTWFLGYFTVLLGRINRRYNRYLIIWNWELGVVTFKMEKSISFESNWFKRLF